MCSSECVVVCCSVCSALLLALLSAGDVCEQYVSVVVSPFAHAHHTHTYTASALPLSSLSNMNWS